MGTRSAKSKTEAFTLIELLVIICIIAIMAMMIGVPTAADKRKAQRINCVNNLHEINTAFRVWDDQNGNYPMRFYATNTYALKLMAGGNDWHLWQMCSNELGTPKVLYCTADTARIAATSFATGFGDSNISYFLNLDATENSPNMIMDGDDNLAVNGIPVKPGILNLPTTNSLAWTKERHVGDGNVSLADGSVQQMTTSGLNAAVVNATNGTSVTTFRLVIP